MISQKWCIIQLKKRLEKCEKEIKRQREENKKTLLVVTKRILREPEKLSEELDDLEKIDKMVEEFIRS